MEIEKTWDNDQAISHTFTGAKVNKNFNVLYEEFEDRCSSVRGVYQQPHIVLDEKDLDPQGRG